MKHYTQVVEERYDGLSANTHIYSNIYSLINPIGFYASSKIRLAFYKAFNRLRKLGIDLPSVKILDIGCGAGNNLRLFSEFKGTTEGLFGFDLSRKRIELAKSMDSTIEFQVADMVNFPSYSSKFDIITAIDVFMHLESKSDILKSLNNIKFNLTDDGYFIWYDAYSKNHFNTKTNADHCGFSANQMIQLSKEAGFDVVEKYNLFKMLFWKYHSLYLLSKFSMKFVKLLEYTLPGNAGNYLIIFKKQN